MIAASLQPDGQTSGLHGPEVPHHHLQVAVGFAEHRDELGLLLRTHEGLQVRRELMEAAGVVLQSVDQIGSPLCACSPGSPAPERHSAPLPSRQGAGRASSESSSLGKPDSEGLRCSAFQGPC